MTTLVLSALVLLLATPALAADAGKPPVTNVQGSAPPVRSDAVKPLVDPNVVPPPAAKPVPPPKPVATPKVTPPAPGSAPSVSGPKVTPDAPAAGRAAPTLPAAGIPGIDPKLGATIRDANQLDQIRDLKQLQQLYGDPMRRGAPAGAGDQGPGRTLGTGRVGAPPGDQGPRGLGRDCIAGNCMSGTAEGARDILGRRRDRWGSSNASNRMGGPPTLGGALGNPGGAASGDGALGGSAGSAGAGAGDQQPDDETNTDRAVSRVGQFQNATRTGDHKNGGDLEVYSNGEVDTSWTTDSTGTHGTLRVRDSEGNTIYARDTSQWSNGDVTVTERVEGALIRTRVDATGRTTVSKQAVQPPSSTQPREDPSAGSGGNDGCSWAPLHGCLNPREDIRTTIRQRTGQPGVNPDAEGTEGGAGSSRGGSTGPAAVTNTGDGSFGTERGGSSGQGTPIWQTLPDPARGGPGGPAPGSPVRRVGSDAGIDAGTGAIQSPPPPPR